MSQATAGAAGSPDAQAAPDAAAAAAAAAGAPAAGDAAAAGTAGAGDPPAAAAGADPNAQAPPPAGEPPARVVPDTYAFTLPEGGLLEQSDLAHFAELAKAAKWTQEEAQAALTAHVGAITAQAAQFLTDLTAHPEIGGDKLAAAQQRANAVLDKFLPASSPEGALLRSGLNKSGYGNYAPMVLLLNRIGAAMGEDRPLGSASSGAAKRSHADVLFGDATR